MSKSNQSWLEAYEAQKAKRLESIKNGPQNPFSLSGLEKVSGEKTRTAKPQANKPVTLSSISLGKPSNGSTNQVKEDLEAIKTDNCDNGGPAYLRPRKNSVDNSVHERIEAEKLASIEAFSQPPRPIQSVKPTQPVKPVNIPSVKPVQKPTFQQEHPEKAKETKRKQNEEPSVKSLFKKAKVDAKKDVKDWQKEYEERKRLAMEKLNK